MLELPDITLVMIETREHDLALKAIQDCENKVRFGEVLVFTDQIPKFNVLGRRCVSVPDWPEKIGWSRFLWNDVAPYIKTSHLLVIQWDSWVKDPEMWTADFLNYDYIGAPWWYKNGMNVGNGGFSLRSTALMRYVRKHRDVFPCVNNIDDDQLCRKYRIELEGLGFKWAPEDVAANFAFECVRPDPKSKHFGFHAMFNWPAVLETDKLVERIKLAAKSPYIRNGYMWEALCKHYPAAQLLV